MTFAHSGREVGVESASVVTDGEEQPPAVDASRNLDVVGVAVPHGVDGEFAHDTQNCVEHAIREELAGRIEAHL